MIRASICAAILLAGAARAQQFEVASIKPSKAATDSTSGIYTGHGRLDAQNVTLLRCIMGAYGIGPREVSGGPDWIDSDRFDILAKADQPVNQDAALMVMLQTLLADRFKLAFHRETRTIQALVLEVAKNGPKLEKADPGEASTNTSGNNAGITIEARKLDMDSLARALARQTKMPVLNGTALEGTFNFQLSWASDQAAPLAGDDRPSLFTAIQDQLGLRLRSEKTPVEILVIDHAEKPSEN
jgi:uncharacterized protein (TIGR03435 family)